MKSARSLFLVGQLLKGMICHEQSRLVRLAEGASLLPSASVRATGRGAGARLAVSPRTGTGLNPSSTLRSVWAGAVSNGAGGEMESELMKNRLAADGRRRSKRKVQVGWYRLLCNPLVLKAVIAVGRLIYELLHIFLRH
jgi:hypothetical protein